jgi:protein-L-isoaspartate(D-aspartate) O-methyltransferase
MAGKRMSEAAMAPARRETEQPGAATAVLRRTMVDRQLRPFDVTDVPLIESFLDVPREFFLPERLATLAYSDLAATLHTASGVKRTLLPPLVLARMIQAAAPRPQEKALAIGGAGYSAALLADLVGSVVAVESDADIAARAVEGLCVLGAGNVRVEVGPLAAGAPAHAPFDIILIEGASESDLAPLFAQLGPNGRLLAIQTPEAGAGRQLVRFQFVDGRPAGRISLLSVTIPVLEGFEKPPAFAF